MWASWAEYVYDTRPERFTRYAAKVGNAGPGEGIAKTVEYFKSLDMPTCFSETEFGVQSKEVIEELALRCSFNETRKVGSFRPLDRVDLLNIYTKANI
jgi:alcohol dehydrogenase YqhD (iron-dependent ADH family)